MVNCERFLDDYSSFRDGLLPMREMAAFRAHLDECPCCAHYDRVVCEGVEVLHALPQLEVSEDFGARLQHRIWHEDMDRLEVRRRARTFRFAGGVGITAAAAGLALGLVIRPAASRVEALAPVATVETQGVGGYVVDDPHPEVGRVSSELAQLGVRVYELPYHDVVYRRDATLVASLAEYSAASDQAATTTR
jgi:hypothetical protein